MGIEQTLRSLMNILSSIIDESNIPNSSENNNNSRTTTNGHYSTDKTKDDNGSKHSNGSRSSSNGATTSPLLRGFLSSFSMGNGAECVFPTLSYTSPQTPSSVADQHDDNNSLSGNNLSSHANDDGNDNHGDGGHPYHVDEYSDRHPRKRKRRSFIYANNFLASLENLEAIGDSEQSEHHFSDPLPQSLLSLQPSHEEISTAMAREMRYYPEDERYDEIATVPHKLLRNAADVMEKLIDIRVRIYVGILAQRKLEKGEGFSQSERDLLSYTNKEDGDKIPQVVFGESRFIVSPFAQSKVTELGGGADGAEESIEIKLPFTFMCTFEVKMRNDERSIPLEIQSTGYVSGIFTANNSSFLKSVHLDIKTPQLVKSMMVQVDRCMDKMFRHVITPESPDPVEEIDPAFQDECDDVDFPYAVESAFACGSVIKTYDEHEVRRKAMENARAAMETAKAAAAAAAEKRFSLPPGRRLSMGQVEKKLTARRHSAAQAERRRSANGFDRSSSAASAVIQRRNLGRRISLEGMDRNQMMERCVLAAQRLSSQGGDMSNKRKLTTSQVERRLSEKRLKEAEHQEVEKRRGSAVSQNGVAQIAKNGITLPRGFGQNRSREESLLDHMEHRRIIAQKFMDKLTTPGMTDDNSSSASRRISIEPSRRNSYGKAQRRISMEPQRRQHERRATAEPLSLNNFSRNGLSMAEAIQRLGDYTEQEIDEDEMDRPINTQAIFGPPTRRISMESTHVPRETIEQMERFAEMDPGVKNLSMAEKVQRISMAEAVQRSYDDAPNNQHPHSRRGSIRRGSAPGRRISLEPTDPRKRQRGNIRGMAEAVERLANELREEDASAEDDHHDDEQMHSSAGGSHERMSRRGSFVAHRRPAIDGGRLDMGGTMALHEGAPQGGDDDPAARKPPPAERRSSYGRRRRISLEPVRRQSVNESPMNNNDDHRYSPGGGGNQQHHPDDVDRGEDDNHSRAFAAAAMGGDDHEASMNMSTSSASRRRRRHSLQQPSQPSQPSQQPMSPSGHNRARPENSTQQPCANEQQPVEEDRTNAERGRGRQRPGRRISIERMDPTVQGQFDD